MKFENIINNYINGNLKDFAYQYSKLRRTTAFWQFVSDYYGEQVKNDAMNYLIRKGL